MIELVKCYSAECDVCKETFEHPYEGWTIFSDKSALYDRLQSSDWHVEDDTDKCYCPKCHEVDDDDNLIIKPPLPKP